MPWPMVLVRSKDGLSRTFEGSAGSDALNDLDAIKHRSRCPVPLRQHQHVTRATCGDGLLELRPASGLYDVVADRVADEPGRYLPRCFNAVDEGSE